MDLKELSKNLNFIVMPSSLWAVHTEPQCDYIAILHIQLKLFASLHIDKGIVITFNNTSKMVNVSFFVQNSFVEIPSVNNTITSISDLTNLIYYIHNLKVCLNAPHQSQYPECAKYIDLEQYDKLCPSCFWKERGNRTENDWKTTSMENSYRTETSDYLNDTQDTLECLQNIYSCEICDKNFLTKLLIEEHLDQHRNSESFVCNICDKVSTSFNLHKRHMLVHSNKANLCSMCGKTFRQYSRLKEHLLTHSTESQFCCDICNKMFSKLYNLKLHKKIHTGVRPYICSSCGKTYTTQSNLSTHVRSTHTNKKPYICSSCSMSFVHPRHLRVHMRKHTGEKPYKCSICEKTFAKNIHLTVHMRTHTGEKPYICTLCGKGFTTTGNLSSHKKVHHKDINNDVTK